MPLEPGMVYAVTTDLWSVSYHLPAGHRLRVEVSSSNFDRYDRNLNTGGAFGRTSEVRTAGQTIHHDRDRQSHIVLPVRPHRD